MGEEYDKDGVNQSVVNRVLSAFITAVTEEEDLSEVAPHLKAALLDTDNLKEEALRKALFDEGAA